MQIVHLTQIEYYSIMCILINNLEVSDYINFIYIINCLYATLNYVFRPEE